MLRLPWAQGALDSGYSPDAPLFSSPGVTYVTLRWAFHRLLRMRGSHWELLFLHWEQRGWVKLQRSGRKLECIPQWESTFGGPYDPGQEASYKGAVEGLTITRPIKPLGTAPAATSSTTAPTVAPEGLRIRNKVEGCAWRYKGGGHGHGSPWRERPCPPSPNQVGLGI